MSETAVDESRKETANRVARPDRLLIVSGTCTCYSDRQLPTFICFLRSLLELQSSVIFFTVTFFLYFLLLVFMNGVLWVAWVDDQPALFISCCLTHPLRGWGMVDESWTETADRVATYY